MKSWKKLLSAVLALSLAIPGVAMSTEVQAAEANLALQGKTTASSYESGTTFTGAKATDGNMATRWGTGQNAGAGEWLQVDLGADCTINSIVINFERTDAEQNILGYHVEIDGETVYTKAEKAAQVETINFDTAKEGQVVKLVIDEADGGTLNWVNVGVNEFEIFGEGDFEENPEAPEATLTNLALNKSAVADSAEVNYLGASNAVDGDTEAKSSRWASAVNSNPHWIYVDLGEAKTVQTVRVIWETRKPTAYKIQISDNASTWTDAKVFTDRPADKDDVIVLDEAVNTRYVRLYIESFTAKDPDSTGEWNNVSIYEMEVYSGVFVKPVAPIDAITVETPKKGDKKLVVNLPESNDYTVTYNGTDYEQVIGDDLTIYEPIVDTTVKVSFKAENKTDAGDYEFKEFEVTVPGKYTQEAGDNAAPAVLPELREWKGYTGNFAVAENTKVVIASEELREVAEVFAADYEDLFGKAMAIVVGTVDTVKAGEFFFALTEDESKGLDEEGYLMEIKDVVTVEAEDATGAMWATRTILQALKSGDMTIPQGITRDYPLYEVRGVILDVGRKTFKLDFLQQMAKQMSWYKMNDFHVHLNDNLIFLEDCRSNGLDPNNAYSGFRLESDVKAGDTVELNAVENGVATTKTFTYQADLTSKDVFYTKDEFRSFMQEAAAMGVNIVPEFDTPAHALAFTKVIPELSLGEGVRNGRGLEEFDLTNQYEESFDFVTNVFDEYMAADMENPVFTEGGVVHVGCDEYFGENEAFRKYCRDIADYVESTGRTARLWGSLSAKRGTTVVDGTGVQMNMWSASYALADEMYELGFDMIDCNEGPYYIVPNAGYYNDFLNASTMYNDELNNIAGVSFPAGDKQILGGSYALWNDMIDLYDNGISEYDCYRRLTSNMGLFAAKSWGKGDLTQAEATEIQKIMGDAPNTNFGYEVEADENYVVAEWPEEVKLNGGASYVTTGLETVGLNHELTFMVQRTSDSTEDQILFESAYGSIKAVQGTTGKVGITRENRDYSFNYELPVGEWVELTIKNSLEQVSLYVNGDLTDTIGDDETCVVTKANGSVNRRPLLATCMLPVAKIGSETNAFEGNVKNVSIKAEDPRNTPDYDGYDLPVEGIALTAGSLEPTEGSLEALLDGNADSFYHSNWSGQRPTADDFWITLELPEVTEVSGMRYLPRQSSANGRILSYVISYSLDGEEWTEIATGDWADNSSWKLADFGTSVEAKFVKIFATDSKADASGRHLTAAELRLVNKKATTAPEIPETEVCKVFTDVEHGAWYEGSVQYVYDEGIIVGDGDIFAPNDDTTRAMVATILYRLAGSPEVTDYTEYNKFTDLPAVEAGFWYTDAVAWALNAGVSTGDDYHMLYNPTAPVTREQLALFLYRYEAYTGEDVTVTATYDELFGVTYVDEWAKEGFAWAVENGIIKGAEATDDAGNTYYALNPQGGATRAQLARVLHRYVGGATE